MEVLAIGLFGLAGKYISERFKNHTDDECDDSNNPNKDNPDVINEDDEGNSTTVNGFDQKYKVQDVMDAVTRRKKILSEDPHNKNIIPTLFNKRVYDKDTENKYLSSTKYMTNTIGDSMLDLYKGSKNLMEGPANELTTLDEQFSPMVITKTKPAEANNSKLTLPDNWTPFNKNDDDMTYKIFNKDELIHNNMQPFFKDKGLLITEESARNMEQTLDIYTGSSRFYFSKREVPNITENFEEGFSTAYQPIALTSFTRGTPNQVDLVQDRFFSGKERRNDKPFDDVKITPGLNLGAYEDGKVGFQDPYNPPTKTIDELRRVDDPQISESFPVTKGNSGYGKSAIIGRVVNKKPATFGTLSQDYGVVPNFAAVQKPQDPGNWNFDSSHRGLDELFQQGVMGPVNSEYGASKETFGKEHNPFKRLLPGLEQSPMINQNIPNLDMGSYNNTVTQRTSTNTQYTGGVAGGNNAGDMSQYQAKATNRTDTQANNAGIVGGSNIAGSISEYQSMATNRINTQANYSGLVGGEKYAGDMSEYQAKATNRIDTQANYSGLVGGENYAGDMSQYQAKATNRINTQANYSGLVSGENYAGDMSEYQQKATNRIMSTVMAGARESYTGGGGYYSSVTNPMATNRINTNSNYMGVVRGDEAGNMSQYQQMATNRTDTNTNFMGIVGSTSGVSETTTGSGERNMFFRDNKQSLLERLPPTKVNAYQPPNASTNGKVGIKELPYSMIMGNALKPSTSYLPFVSKNKNIAIPSTYPNYYPPDMEYNNPYINNVLYKVNLDVVKSSEIDSFFNQFGNDEQTKP